MSSTLSIDLTLEYGKATAQVEDSTGAPVGSALILSTAPTRVAIQAGDSVKISGDGTDIYRVLLVHSGSSDSGTIEVNSTQGKYHLKPSVSSRLGNSVIIEETGLITINEFVVK